MIRASARAGKYRYLCMKSMRIMPISSERPVPQRTFRGLRAGVLILALAVAAGCATGRAVRSADEAARRGDWDAAVTFYREALARAPGRADLRIKLERSTRMASAEHVARARQLEEQDQLPGAMAEYRLAANLDPSNVLAAQKAAELDRRIREQVESARAQSSLAARRDQTTTAAIPRLDPRAVVPEMRFDASVRDILGTLSSLTGINMLYDQGLDAALSRPYAIEVQETPVEEVLNQILTANSLAFRVENPRTIFIYQDTPQNRLRYEYQYMQHFHLSAANATQVMAQINQLLQGMQLPVPPTVTADETSNTITARATAPVLQMIQSFIAARDRALPEVLIEAEILEVDRSFLRQLGLNLSQWAFGFAFSPEVGPAQAPGTLPPETPPPFNLNTLSNGVSAADFYMTTPSALINLLQSDSRTRTLSQPSARATAGSPVTLTMGQDVPIPTTVFQSAAAGGVATIPTTSVSYQPVGVNLRFTPIVTYENEIILSDLILEKSGLGANLEIGGQTFPTIVSRKAQSSVRLRDGESTLLAGLLLDETRDTTRGLPGTTGIPLIRNILGGSEDRIDQTDIVMIITPRIVRGHGLTDADLRPMFVGTGANVTTSTAPPLLSPEALGLPATAPGAPAPTPPAPAAAPGPEAPTPLPPPGAGDSTPEPPAAAPIVPIEPTPAAPATGQTGVVVVPPTGADALLSGGGPYTIPIQIVGANDIATISLTITWNPSILRDVAVTQGSFMGQGGVEHAFVPAVDQAAGRLDLALTRPASEPGASGDGLLAAITFRGGEPGSTEIRVTGVATTRAGRAVPLQFGGATLTVR
jgi:general secretion pathway protein D